MSTKKRVGGAERRELILSAAREQFSRHGYHGAATAAIAKAAGCSEAVLYRHFSSKRELLLAVLAREVGGRVEGHRAIAPPPGGGLPDALRARIEDEDMAVTARLILLTLALTEDPEIAETMLGWFGIVRAPLRAVLAAGQESGQIRDDIDAETLTWLWHGLFLVAAVRNSIAADGGALGAVEAGRVLSELLKPPAP